MNHFTTKVNYLCTTSYLLRINQILNPEGLKIGKKLDFTDLKMQLDNFWRFWKVIRAEGLNKSLVLNKLHK